MPANILYINWSGGIGGAEVALMRLIHSLDKDRYKPLVWQMQEGLFSRKILEAGIPLMVSNLPRFRSVLPNLRFHLDLLRVLKKEDIDMVHANGTLSYLAAYAACRIARIPLVWWLVDLPEGKAFPERIAGSLPADFVVCNSKATQEAFTQFYGKKGKTAVVYPSIDFPLSTEPDAEFRQKFFTSNAIPQGAKLVLSAGRLQRWKGQDVLVRACYEVLRKHPDTIFLFSGDALPGMEDGYKKEIQQIAREMNVYHSCRFLGHTRDLSAVMKVSGLVVHTSVKPEPFGLVVAEAMSLGKPVIASRQGGPLEMITDGVDGLLVPPSRPEVLAEAIVKILDDADHAKRMGEAARKKAQRFENALAVAEMENVYARVLKC